jgi:hypothetical protein
MIAHTTFGLFRFASNLKLFPPLQISLLTCAHSLAPPSRASSATTVVNFIILWPARSSSLTVLHFACRAPIGPSKMARPNPRFTPLIILCVLCYFRRAFLRSTGLRQSGQLAPHQNTRLLHPVFHLYSTPPTYDHLRVFGCACYPNMSSTAPHKLAPRSSLCVFLGYSSEHKGYRCLELESNRILTSRHVVFDESFFPFADMPTTPMESSVLDFLLEDDELTAPIFGAKFVNAGSPSAAPRSCIAGCWSFVSSSARRCWVAGARLARGCWAAGARLARRCWAAVA